MSSPCPWSLKDVPYLVAVENGRDAEGLPSKEEATRILNELLTLADNAQLEGIADWLAYVHTRANQGANYSRSYATYLDFLKREQAERQSKMLATMA